MKGILLTTIFLFFCSSGFTQFTHKFEVISQFDTVWVKKETRIKAGQTLIMPVNAYAYAVYRGTAEFINIKGKVTLFKAQRYRECLKRIVNWDRSKPVKYTDETWQVNVPIKQVTAMQEDVVLSWITLYKKPSEFQSKGDNHILYDRSTGKPIDDVSN